MQFMNRKKIIIVVNFIIFITIGYFMGPFLEIQGKAVTSDVIVVLSGDCNRLKTGIELYEKGLAPKIIISNYQEFESSKELNTLPSDVIIKEKNAKSTYENAAFVKEIMNRNNMNSANIVTSDYHTRRTKLIFSQVFKDSKIELNYVNSPNSNFDLDKWFMSLHGITEVGTEYLKILLAFFQIDELSFIQNNILYQSLHSSTEDC